MFIGLLGDPNVAMAKECGAIDQVLRSVRFELAPATGPYGRIYTIGAMTVLEMWLAMASVEACGPNTDTWSYVASMN
jgi:hypothetical protein